MKRLVFAVGLMASIISSGAIAAPSDTEIRQLVQAQTQAISDKDPNAIANTYAPNVVIIDEFAPYVWSGANTAKTFWDGFAPFASRATDFKLTVGDPSVLRIEEQAGTGYGVFPLHIRYKIDGKPRAYNGSMTYAFVRTSGKWLISGWAYSRGKSADWTP